MIQATAFIITFFVLYGLFLVLLSVGEYASSGTAFRRHRRAMRKVRRELEHDSRREQHVRIYDAIQVNRPSHSGGRCSSAEDE